MIDIIKQTPIEYSKQSRDYQVLARLYTALFNVSKMYIDNLQVWNSNIDNKLASLRAKTLNFDAKHSWDENDLEAVTSSFKYLMMNKGTIKALEYVINILLKIEKINGESVDEPITIDNYKVTIRVPENLFTIGVLEDLVRYILPAGLTYDIVTYRTSNISGVLKTEINYYDGDVVGVEEPYTSKMYIGPSHRVVIGDGTSTEIRIDPENKVWVGLDTDEYVPDDDQGILHKTGVELTLDDGTTEEVNSRTADNVSVVISETQIIEPKEITDTFIYRKKDHEKEGVVDYHEEWDE